MISKDIFVRIYIFGYIYLLHQKYSKTEILLQFKTVFYIIIYLKNVINSCEGKAEFSASLLQNSVSRDPSEIISICQFGGQETFLIINV